MDMVTKAVPQNKIIKNLNIPLFDIDLRWLAFRHWQRVSNKESSLKKIRA